jgi:hypothetical protein
MVTEKPEIDSFTRFVVANESKLGHILIATYGWERWERLRNMENPGRLFGVLSGRCHGILPLRGVSITRRSNR